MTSAAWVVSTVSPPS